MNKFNICVLRFKYILFFQHNIVEVNYVRNVRKDFKKYFCYKNQKLFHKLCCHCNELNRVSSYLYRLIFLIKNTHSGSLIEFCKTHTEVSRCNDMQCIQFFSPSRISQLNNLDFPLSIEDLRDLFPSIVCKLEHLSLFTFIHTQHAKKNKFGDEE